MSTDKVSMSLKPHSPRATGGASRPASATAPDPEVARAGSQESWTTYLGSLRRPQGSLAAEHADHVAGFWRQLRSCFQDQFPVPQAGPTEAPGLLLVWDRDRHHLEVEIFRDGTYDWFYRDREDESYLGGEGLEADARPRDFLDRLRLFCHGAGPSLPTSLSGWRNETAGPRAGARSSGA